MMSSHNDQINTGSNFGKSVPVSRGFGGTTERQKRKNQLTIMNQEQSSMLIENNSGQLLNNEKEQEDYV